MRKNLFGVPQGSILGRTLLIFLCNLFLFIENKGVGRCADDTTLYETKGRGAILHMLYVT